MRAVRVAAMLLILLLAVGCQGQPRMVTREAFLFDTPVTIKAYGPSGRARSASAAALRRMAEIDRRLNYHDADSELSRLNRRAGRGPVRVSTDLMRMVVVAKAVHDKTEGAFDVTIGPVAELWRFGRRPAVPSRALLAAALPLVNSDDVVVGVGERTVELRRVGMKIDLGGVAKGYAVDEAVRVLKRRGIRRALITTVSSTRVIGSKPDGRPWRVGIESPRRRGRLVSVLRLTDRAVSTSGDYQQSFIRGGRRYHHLLDPRTGMPARGLASLTVVHEGSAAEADALSTGLFVLGRERAATVAKRTSGLKLVMVGDNGRLWHSRR